MPTVTIQCGAEVLGLSEDEVGALFWAHNYIVHHQREYGPVGSAMSRLLVAGGEFDEQACGELLAFCRVAREKLAGVELEVFKRKYGSNTLPFSSDAALDLVLRYKLAYRNLNVDPPAIFVGKKRQPDAVAPQRIGELPPFVSAVATVERAAKAGMFSAVHSDAKEFF